MGAFGDLLGQEADLAITTSLSAANALDLLNREYFDVIIADFSMPEMDGLTLLKEIRERGGQSIFVMATAQNLAHIAQDALNTGADYYFQKGTDMADEVGRLLDFIRVSVPQKNTEYDLMVWARFYNSIVDDGPELISRIKPDGSFSYVNEPCVRLFNKPYLELVQENFFTFVPDSERKGILLRINALSPEKPDCLLGHHVISGNGRSVSLEWSYRGFFSPAGEVREYQVVGRDTSGLEQIGEDSASDPAPAEPKGQTAAAEEEHSDNRGDIVATLQSLDTPVFAVDTDGVIIAWSEKLAQLTGVPSADMIGKGGQAYAVPFYGRPGPMLIDHMTRPDESDPDNSIPSGKKVGDTYIGEKEHVVIRGRPMILQGKCSPVQDAAGRRIAAIEAITVSEERDEKKSEKAEEYLGGISSPTLRTADSDAGGGIGSTAGGCGIYATSRRLFIIRNPDHGVSAPQAGARLGAFLGEGLFGMSSDTRQKSIGELEGLSVFSSEKGKIARAVLKKPVLLSGYLDLKKTDGTGLRVYIHHKKAYIYIENLLRMFCPEILSFE